MITNIAVPYSEASSGGLWEFGFGWFPTVGSPTVGSPTNPMRSESKSLRPVWRCCFPSNQQTLKLGCYSSAVLASVTLASMG